MPDPDGHDPVSAGGAVHRQRAVAVGMLELVVSEGPRAPHHPAGPTPRPVAAPTGERPGPTPDAAS